nr:serpin family protein [Evansella tamaricis]
MNERVENFGLNLLDQLFNGKNQLFSPLSIYTALAMVLPGANGQTKKEILQVLKIKDVEENKMHLFHKGLQSTLREYEKELDLNMANSFWIKEDLMIKNDYVEFIKKNYNAHFGEITTKQQINNWIKLRTEGKVEEIVDEINNSLILLLINTVYFQGNWSKPFDKELTSNDFFISENESKITVPFMMLKESLKYDKTDLYEIIKLPYSNNSLYMEIILPKKTVNMKKLINEFLKGDEIWICPESEKVGTLILPKFKLESDLNLNNILMSLSMHSAFNPSTADFLNMVSKEEEIFISDVKHKAYMEVSEEGTEAAAVSSVEMRGGSVGSENTFEMVVNRPFIFQIRENNTGVPVFLGYINNPATKI